MFSWWRRLATPPTVEVTVQLPDPLRTEVVSLLGRDGQIDAVRLVRRTTGLTLLPATRAVDALDAEGPALEHPESASVVDDRDEREVGKVAGRRDYVIDGQVVTLLLGVPQPWAEDSGGDWAVVARLVDDTGRERWQTRVGGVDQVQASLMAMLAAGNHLAHEREHGRDITFAGSDQLGLPVLAEPEGVSAQAVLTLW